MKGIIRALDKAFSRMEEQGWDKIYILVDIHDTIFRACYTENDPYDMFPYAEQVLKMLSARKDISLILWTSTYQNKIAEYIRKLKSMGIYFDMVNCNFEVENTKLSCFDEKPYFNVGIDDKFGFDGETDWKELYDYLNTFVTKNFLNIMNIK